MSINLLANQNYQTKISNLLPGSNIYLIGMMGSGKTTIGKYLAQDLNYNFVDTDQELEARKKKPISDIFQKSGETNFRELETKVLEDLSDKTNHVIATGGGIIQQQINWDYLQNGLTIWLNVHLSILKKRLAQDETRPLADKLESLLAIRHPLYAHQADIQIEITQEQPPEEISSQIIKMIPTVLKSKV
jgi:shikimate kinase